MRRPHTSEPELNLAQKLGEKLILTFSEREFHSVYEQLDEILMILAVESSLEKEDLARIYFTVRCIRDAFQDTLN